MNFLHNFYLKVYITIIIENKYIEISVNIEKAGKQKENKYRRFKLTSRILTKEIIRFIEKHERRSPFSYICVLNSALEQGAKKGCSSINMKDKVWLCVGNKKRPWSIYLDVVLLHDIQKKFINVGIDFIFSPFSIISNHCQEIKKNLTQMFIFILEDSISIAIFQHSSLEFAKQLILTKIDSDFDENSELLIDKESINENFEEDETLDEINSIDELDDIEILDDQELLEDFSELKEESVTTKNQVVTKNKTPLKGFSRNFRRFELIQKSIHDFYQSANSDTSFIEDIYLLNPHDDCADLKAYLEDELFVKVYFKDINIHQVLVNLTKNEIKNAS